jgi:glucokinase
MKQVVVGMDIGGTNAPFNFVDKDGNTLLSSNINLPTASYGEAKDFINAFHTKIQEALKQLPDVEVKGIGIGAPNGNYYKGTIELAPNLPWKGLVPFVDMLKEHYDLPIYITNDANAAAIGEGVFGGAKGMKDYIVITLGTGLGSGIVAGGQMIYGFNGFAGELGHTTVVYGGRQCGCGRKGCLETYASATGLKRTVFELLGNSNAPSVLRDVTYNELTAEMVSKAANNGDAIALEAYNITGDILGRMLADFVAFSTPEAFFLFGGLAYAGDLIFKPTIKSLNENLMPIFKNKIKVLPSGLSGNNAAILGAAALTWEKLLNE